ncbi:hypothetical protein DFJ74DRAFT_387164 [Hyaloraphidium curvatum]|nr:hypothetical protein DFJ74DRAFT_387164 [Hyaloraphidium curvatum]
MRAAAVWSCFMRTADLAYLSTSQRARRRMWSRTTDRVTRSTSSSLTSRFRTMVSKRRWAFRLRLCGRVSADEALVASVMSAASVPQMGVDGGSAACMAIDLHRWSPPTGVVAAKTDCGQWTGCASVGRKSNPRSSVQMSLMATPEGLRPVSDTVVDGEQALESALPAADRAKGPVQRRFTIGTKSEGQLTVADAVRAYRELGYMAFPVCIGWNARTGAERVSLPLNWHKPEAEHRVLPQHNAVGLATGAVGGVVALECGDDKGGLETLLAKCGIGGVRGMLAVGW